MHSHRKAVWFVENIVELHNKRPRVSTNNNLFQSSPPHTYCSPLIFLYYEVDENFLDKLCPPFTSFCDWGAGIGMTIKYTKELFPKVDAYGVEKDYELIKQVKDTGHKPIHGNCLTFAKVADLNYTFNISWDVKFKTKMFRHIIELMKAGQILIESYDNGDILRQLSTDLSCDLINPSKDSYPYTIVRKI